MLRILLAGIVANIVTPVWAMDGPELPSTARKLTKVEIVSMMDGKTFKYTSYNHDELKTGKTKFNFKKMTYSGTYTDVGKTKNFKDEPLSFSSQSYCYDKKCPEGGGIYVDRSNIYEVSENGKVGEVLTK